MSDEASSSANELQVALVGNPNTGKTTLFNRLTGLRQRTGNFPGVTVEKITGRLTVDSTDITITDLPGTYSLSANSKDEALVVECLCGRLGDMKPPDVVVCIADATNLQRHLFLFSQITDLGLPMVLVLNFWDQVKKQHIHIDVEGLSQHLGVPVVPVVATRGDGIDELKRTLCELAKKRASTLNTMAWPEAINNASQRIVDAVQRDMDITLTGPEARRILFDAKCAVADFIGWHSDRRDASIHEARTTIEQSGYHPLAVEPLLHYQRIKGILSGVVQVPKERPRTPTDRIDRILTHRVFGLAFFTMVMMLVFQSVYAWSGPLMDAIDSATGWLQSLAEAALSPHPALHSLVSDGIIAGVGSVVIFLPQIMILFLFIAILEDTGYMARAAYLMDRLFSWCGLNGKSFVPMLTSYACAVPGIMATRTIEDPRSRITTILIAPLMSCSARLPVYVLMIGAFIEPKYGPGWAAFTLFLFHMLGLTVAIPVAWVINRFVLKTDRQPFVLEMPPYRRPRLRNTLWRVIGGARSFLKRAGTLILVLTIILWILAYFPRSEERAQGVEKTFVEQLAESRAIDADQAVGLLESDPAARAELDRLVDSAHIENSYLGRMGKAVQPAFAGAGFDWKITVGILASFPAREVIIATLGVLYNLGGEVDETSHNLRDALGRSTWRSGPLAGQPVFSIPVVLAIMVFFALCMQCGATLVTMARESSWRWPLLAFTYMTTLAWIGAVITYQVARLVIGA